ncbi:B-cell receptor CD22 [Oryzias melastigma]|uniref:B-cell receptor CD22 n=1 Tax=Oryzias melastigma TaxID=30732 RepID=A0A834CHA8_ORYME|nr:B-cell receptor CD22 [Oryzias melastigma]
MKGVLVLLFLGGAFSSWMVEYPQKETCALKGSSVILPCYYDYPESLVVEGVKWGHKENFFDGPFIYDSELNQTWSRFTYSGDKNHNCSLRIDQVEDGDAGKFAFRFITNSDDGKFTGEEGTMLKIGDLRISLVKPKENDVIKEGNSASLTCTSSCDGGEPSPFIWLKDGEVVHNGSVLSLTDMSSTHSGNYCCTYNGATSGGIRIDVEFGPKNTNVEVYPSEEVDEGTNVTLICNSHANPAVMNYTWFKKHRNNVTVLGEQRKYSFGKFSQRDDGQYFCRSTNKHGSSNSSDVTVKVKVPPTKLSAKLIVILSCVVILVLLVVTSVAAKIKFCKNRITSTETDCEEETQDNIYVNLPDFDKSQSQEETQNDSYIVYTPVQLKRKSDMEEQTDSHDESDSVIYSVVCRESHPLGDLSDRTVTGDDRD